MVSEDLKLLRSAVRVHNSRIFGIMRPKERKSKNSKTQLKEIRQTVLVFDPIGNPLPFPSVYLHAELS